MYLVFLVISVGLVWSYVSRIDIIIGAPGILIREGRAVVIQPNIAGVVRELAVREGDFVTAGQQLAVIEADETGRLIGDDDRSASVGPNTADRALRTQRMLDTQVEFEAKRLAHVAALARVDEQVRGLQEEIDYDTRRQEIQAAEVEVHRKLREEDLESEMDWLKVQQAYQENLLRVQRNKNQLRDAVRDRDFLTKDFASVRAEYDNSISRISGQARWTVIRAPASGVVTRMVTRHENEVVTRGQIMMSLVPDDGALIAELRIPNWDIGRIRTGQQVKLKFDAFPYSEYGVIMGELLNVLPGTPDDPDGGASLRAFASVDQDYFMVDGEPVSLRPGMTAIAEVVTEQKSVLEILVKPFRALRQPSEAESE